MTASTARRTPPDAEAPRAGVAGSSSIVASPRRRVVGLALVPVPVAVKALCRRAGQPGGQPVYGGPRRPLKLPSYRRFPPRFPIYCPARLPANAQAQQNLARGRTAYQWEVTFSGVSERRYGAPHVVLGGQRAPFPLRADADATWPPRGARGAVPELRWPRELAVVGRLAVRDLPALALRIRGGGYGSGPNGGHLVLVFNLAGRGYFVSVHFNGLTDRARLDLASAVAESLELQERR